ncbi:unnamed protein product, partial [Nesidiocoris tenuis]
DNVWLWVVIILLFADFNFLRLRRSVQASPSVGRSCHGRSPANCTCCYLCIEKASLHNTLLPLDQDDSESNCSLILGLLLYFITATMFRWGTTQTPSSTYNNNYCTIITGISCSLGRRLNPFGHGEPGNIVGELPYSIDQRIASIRRTAVNRHGDVQRPCCAKTTFAEKTLVKSNKCLCNFSLPITPRIDKRIMILGAIDRTIRYLL